MKMQVRAHNAMRLLLLAVLAYPSPASAGGFLAPFILHPARHPVTQNQVQQADQAFSAAGAIRSDLVAITLDGLVLRGWKVRAPQPNGDWVLLYHGRGENRLAMMPYAKFLLASGYSVVMMDARAHGESGGSISTYGHIERFDSTAILDALMTDEQPRHVFAMGESMGAAVALQAAAVESRIEGVIAEGAFRNLHEVIYDYAGLRTSELLGKTLFRPAAILAIHETEHKMGFDFNEVSPEAAVAKRDFPVLLISGLSDHNIPKRHAQAIYNAATGRKELWLVPGAGHQKAMTKAPEEFRQRVLSFLSSAYALH